MSLSSGRAAARSIPICGKLCSLRFSPVLLLLILSSSVAVFGQMGTDTTGTGGKHVIQGRIYFPSGRRAEVRMLVVRLQNSNSGDLSVMADVNGNFAFKGLAPGSYTVVIEGGEEYENAREMVYIDTDAAQPRRGMSPPSPSRPYTVMVYLQPKRSKAGEAKTGVLDAALANVPVTARDLYLQALESFRLGETKKGIEQLRAAIAQHPEFGLALNQLGVQYLRLNETDKAVEALSHAVRLMADAFPPRLNYGIALLEKKRFTESEDQLRQALKLSEASPLAHYYLGLTLLGRRAYDEAEKELRRSIELGGDSLSLAHKYLGGLYWRNKDYKRAIVELEAYLKLSPKAPDAEQIRTTLKELRGK